MERKRNDPLRELLEFVRLKSCCNTVRRRI